MKHRTLVEPLAQPIRDQQRRRELQSIRAELRCSLSCTVRIYRLCYFRSQELWTATNHSAEW